MKSPLAPLNSKTEGTLNSSKEDPFAKELKILHNLTPGCTISWMIYYICYIDKCISADTYITNTYCTALQIYLSVDLQLYAVSHFSQFHHKFFTVDSTVICSSGQCRQRHPANYTTTTRLFYYAHCHNDLQWTKRAEAQPQNGNFSLHVFIKNKGDPLKM